MGGANAIMMTGSRRPDEDARRRTMVRLNGMMFYCVGIASFLESTPPLDTQRLLKLAEEHADAGPWMERVWLSGRAERGRAFRDYLETTWPEFEWADAYEEFRASYATRAAAHVGPPGLALEYVARCATEVSHAVFYRTLAKSADDPVLRGLAAAAAHDHAAYFGYFRGLVERSGARRRARLTTSCRAVAASCRAGREVDVAAAFSPLGRYWHGGWIFPELTYAEFLARLAQLLRRHSGLGPVERLIFRPWLNPPASAGPSSSRVAPLALRPTAGLPRAA